jgi:hypothetical protein
MVASNGNVWVSNVGGHEVTELSRACTVVHVFADRQDPEGMVQLSSSTMALADQLSDQVVVFNTTAGRSRPWVQLRPNGNLGVDGIGVEPGMLLLPDAARGSLDLVRLPPFSGRPVTVATRLGRAVDATPVGDGTLLVSVENAPGLDRVNPRTGTVRPAAHFASTDDVVVRNGIAYVSDIGGGTMSAVTLSSGRVNTLVTGVRAAQGLAMRADGTFLLVDETSGEIRVARGCQGLAPRPGGQERAYAAAMAALCQAAEVSAGTAPLTPAAEAPEPAMRPPKRSSLPRGRDGPPGAGGCLSAYGAVHAAGEPAVVASIPCQSPDISAGYCRRAASRTRSAGARRTFFSPCVSALAAGLAVVLLRPPSGPCIASTSATAPSSSMSRSG